MAIVPVPDRTEAAEYYFTYIDHIPEGDIVRILEAQAEDTLGLLRGISEEQSSYRYAPDKWSIRQVASHINDTERLFVFRAFWFARGLGEPLPSMDQDRTAAYADADARSWHSHLEEFRAVRAASLAFFRHLSPDAWRRRGTASGYPFTVGALGYITAGHVAHHLQVLRERYLRR